MFKNIPFPSPKVLYISTNILKGGDFMERKDNSGPVTPDTGIVPDDRSDPTHPLVRGRTRPFLSALEIADPAKDPVLFKSVSSMDGRE